MRGYKSHNYPAFFAAAAQLESEGIAVWNPAAADADLDGFDPDTDTQRDLAYYMRRDIPAVLGCKAVYVLPGWEDSEGVAARELVVASWQGIPVVDYETRNRLEVVINATGWAEVRGVDRWWELAPQAGLCAEPQANVATPPK